MMGRRDVNGDNSDFDVHGSALQAVVKVWQVPDAVYTVFELPDDGRRYRLKHVEHFTEINCVALHLVGYTWKYNSDLRDTTQYSRAPLPLKYIIKLLVNVSSPRNLQ
jgi:hypothetical protein